MKVSFVELAYSELYDAVSYYEAIQPGLGERFKKEVKQSIFRVTEFPMSYQSLTANVRRCLVSKFPYGIIYHVAGDEIIVLAVAHLHRKPDYWVNRV